MLNSFSRTVVKAAKSLLVTPPRSEGPDIWREDFQ